MKIAVILTRGIAAALAALLALGCLACEKSEKVRDTGEQETEPEQKIAFDDLYEIYFKKIDFDDGKNSGQALTPFKLNVLTGTSTPLCDDPLCNHSPYSDCPFAGFHINFYYENGILYYQTQSRKNESGVYKMLLSIKSYDIEKKHAKLLYEYEPPLNGNTTGGFFCGYYWQEFYKTKTTDAFAFRVRLSDGKYEQIAVGSPIPRAYYGNEYLFYDINKTGSITSVYAADLDGGGRHDLFTADNITHAFFNDIFNDTLLYCTAGLKTATYGGETRTIADYDKQILWLFDIKTGKSVKLIEGFSDYCYARQGDCIFYTKFIENPQLLGYDDNDHVNKYNRSGGIIWRYNLKTGAEDRFAELPEYDLLRGFSKTVGDRVVVDYLNVDYNDYTIITAPQGKFHDYKTRKGKIVLDPSTGEYKIYPEDTQ